MVEQHDLIQHLGSLQKRLQEDKVPIGLFLGAGCPGAIRDGCGEPLVPDVQGLTSRCVDAAKGTDDCNKPVAKLLAKLKSDGEDSPNIERMLSEIRGILQVVGTGSFRGLTRAELEILERRICDEIVDVVSRSLPDKGTPYHRAASWIGDTDRAEAVEIFTPNYDLLMEQALEEARVPFFDGFAGSRRAFFDPYAIENEPLPSRWVRLWKLHGSVNWYADEGGAIIRTAEQPAGYRCRLIHPSHLKYEESRTMPFFVMIDRLRRFLSRPSAALVMCGYSFRDDHLNAAIADGLEANLGAVAFAIMYGRMAEYPIAEVVAKRRSNLVVLARDGGVIGGTEGAWLRRPPDDSPLWGGAVEWITKETKNGTQEWPELRLGDFAQFGEFLSNLAGAERE